jgi:catechol 2,3-dioxygenase
MIQTDRIGHVVIKVRDLERSRKFYTEVMGLDVMMELSQPKICFFASHRRDHHELGCMEVGKDAAGTQARQIGLMHIAFRLTDEEQLRSAYKVLKENNVPINFTVDHIITKSIYFSDPDGHQIEVYCDNPPEYIAQAKGNKYTGMAKLDFADEEPGIVEAFSKSISLQ